MCIEEGLKASEGRKEIEQPSVRLAKPLSRKQRSSYLL